MGSEAMYDDGRIALDGEGVTLRRYYFPTGAGKHIPYGRIRGFQVRSMGWLTGKARAWGSSHPGYWLPLDMGRPRKEKLVVLDLGGRVKPGFTPDVPDRVVEILTRHAGAS